MLRQVIFTTAPLSKKITGFFSIYLMSRKNRKIFAKKEQSHSKQANRFICLRHSGAHCDARQRITVVLIEKSFCYWNRGRKVRALKEITASSILKKQ